MNKIKALYENEMIKIIRRPSIIAVLAVMVVFSLFWPIVLSVIYLTQYSDTGIDYPKEKVENSLAEAMFQSGNVASLTVNETVTIEVDGQAKEIPMIYYEAEYDQIRALANKECCEDLLSNYDFDKYPLGNTWLSFKGLMSYVTYKSDMYQMNTTPFEERDSDWLKNYEQAGMAVDNIRKALIQHDYESYCEALKMHGKAFDASEDYEIKRVKKLMETDPAGELGYSEASYMMDYLSQIDDKKEMIDSGLDYELPRILTEQKKAQLANEIKILEYKLEKHNAYDEKSFAALQVMTITRSINQFVMVVLVLLIAGSSISQEMATGSIKSLIIAPVRRWKIYTAKLLSIVTWMIAASVLMSLLVCFSLCITFGFSMLPPYLYVAGGAVVEMPSIIFIILYDLAKNIWIFFYAFVAFMISCFTKNTGVSVGMSVGLLLAHTIPNYFAETNFPRVLLEFTPIANMNFAGKAFPYATLMLAEADFAGLEEIYIDNPMNFSLLYCVILTLTILFIAYEQFTKKDIQ